MLKCLPKRFDAFVFSVHTGLSCMSLLSSFCFCQWWNFTKCQCASFIGSRKNKTSTVFGFSDVTFLTGPPGIDFSYPIPQNSILELCFLCVSAVWNIHTLVYYSISKGGQTKHSFEAHLAFQLWMTHHWYFAPRCCSVLSQLLFRLSQNPKLHFLTSPASSFSTSQCSAPLTLVRQII